MKTALTLAILFALTACGKRAETVDLDIELNKCAVESETETGKRIYCGKACTRAEILYVYRCEGGTFKRLY